MYESYKLRQKKGDSQEYKIEILLNEKASKDNEFRINFDFKNPISPYEVLESPDARKLGILVESIKISPI